MIKKSLLFLMLLFITYIPTLSFALVNDITGKKLLDYCQVALDIFDNNYGRVQTESEYLQGSKAGICQGYLMSVNEMRGLMNQNKHASSNYCALNNCNILKVTAVVVKYLKDHPQQLNLPASTLVLNAYQTYFPCR